MRTYKEDTKIMETLTKRSIKCKCGHSINLFNTDRTVCSWCGSFVYKNPKAEFKYQLKEKLREVKNGKRFV